MHQSVGNTIRALEQLQPPAGMTQAHQIIDTAIADTIFATRAALHSALETTPGALAFQRDMVLNIPLIADLQFIRQK